jgi:hypothetical protein
MTAFAATNAGAVNLEGRKAVGFLPVNMLPRRLIYGSDVSAAVKICTDINFGGTCVTLPFVSDSCINLTGGLTTWNKAISSAIVPGGFICTFYE